MDSMQLVYEAERTIFKEKIDAISFCLDNNLTGTVVEEDDMTYRIISPKVSKFKPTIIRKATNIAVKKVAK